MIDPRLLADITKAEGCRLTAYRDGEGNWTIGVGHLLEPQSKDWTGYTLTQEQVDALTTQDIESRQAQAEQIPEWPFLDGACRQNAVTEIIFNMGEENWLNDFPATRKAIRAKDWQGAHDHLLQSPLWIKEVGIGRVTRLADYLLWGNYP